MRLAILLALAALQLAAQNWDPKMPESIPAVSGRVIDAATFRYIDVKIGEGAAAQPGEQYTVHYTGWLRDGTKFDSSIGKEPIVFVQGRRQVIAGWEMGFEGMRVGGKRRGRDQNDLPVLALRFGEKIDRSCLTAAPVARRSPAIVHDQRHRAAPRNAALWIQNRVGQGDDDQRGENVAHIDNSLLSTRTVPVPMRRMRVKPLMLR